MMVSDEWNQLYSVFAVTFHSYFNLILNLNTAITGMLLSFENNNNNLFESPFVQGSYCVS